MNQNLYIVHGIGPDSVGLVEKITAPIASEGGNVVDLRQNVMHGLFTAFLVVDLTASKLTPDALDKLLPSISADTGLKLSMEQYPPPADGAPKENLLLVLVGQDKPGIVASISHSLRQYGINIESSKAIGREGVFLMELLVDISAGVLPVDNLIHAAQTTMASLGIKVLFQKEDVFNKRKRVVLFNMQDSFIPADTAAEIVRQTGIDPAPLRDAFADSTEAGLRFAVNALDRVPVEVLKSVIDAEGATPGTRELIQSLRLMGYRAALAATAADLCTDDLRRNLDLSCAFGFPLPINEDSRAVDAAAILEPLSIPRLDRTTAEIAAHEGISPDDVTVLGDESAEGGTTLGVRLAFDLKALLALHNERVLSGDNMLGILGFFGRPRL